MATAWRILRKRLKWYPYKPHKVVDLTDEHRAGRKEFCEWMASQPEGFATNVIWSDEKWFQLQAPPNVQNESLKLRQSAESKEAKRLWRGLGCSGGK